MNIKVISNQPQPAPPSIGIFWGVHQANTLKLVCDGTPIAMAESPMAIPSLIHRGTMRCGKPGNASAPPDSPRRQLPSLLASAEYEDFPRGHINYDIKEKRFILYADRKLQSPLILQRLIQTFGLQNETTLIRSDEHYQS